MRHIIQSEWFQKLNIEQQKLVQVSVDLYEREYSQKDHKFNDYSFIIFPMAKAYEGFLKFLLYELKLIDKNTFEGKRFRIGKALNPDVNEKSQDEYWLYDDLAQMCGSDMARELWDTWLVCRNRVFHYFPKDVNAVSLETAGSYILKMSAAMKSFFECQIQLNSGYTKYSN
jgi:hypothetical protein